MYARNHTLELHRAQPLLDDTQIMMALTATDDDAEESMKFLTDNDAWNV